MILRLAWSIQCDPGQVELYCVSPGPSPGPLRSDQQDHRSKCSKIKETEQYRYESHIDQRIDMTGQ